MNQSVSTPIKWLPFFILSLLIISANSVLYQTSFFQPVPTAVIIGSMIDFLVVIPVLTYYFIIRNRYSRKLIALVILINCALLNLIIPETHQHNLSFVSKILMILEAGFVIIELYLFTHMIKKLTEVKKRYQTLPEEWPFLIKIKQTFNFEESISRTLKAVLSEVTMLYYAVLSWKKAAYQKGNVFPYHKKTGFVALYLMLIHALAIESVGLHYFLSKIDHTLSIVLLLLNVYSIFFLIGHLQAVVKVPLIAGETELIIHLGFLKGITVPYTAIKELKKYEGPDKIRGSEKKYTFVAMVSDFIPEKPSIELLLNEPVKAQLIYGFTKEVRRIVIKVDEGENLFQLIDDRLKTLK